MKWIDAHLNELGQLSRGRSRHRPRDASHLYGGPYPFVQTGDVKGADLYLTDYSQTYSDAGLAQSRLWPKGTLCITIAANIAHTAILGMDACFPDSVIGFVAYESKCDARFVKYALDVVRAQYQQVSHGAAQDNLSQEKLLSFTIRVPQKVADQTRLADILAQYDNLVEVNRQRMALLEKAARLLYQEWFVRLRFPGHEHASLRAGVPVGWNRRALSRCAKFLSGGTPSKARTDYWEGDIPWVSSGELTELRLHRTALNITAEGLYAGSRLVPPGTILAVVRGMSLAKEFRIGLTAREMAFNQDLKAIVSEPDVDSLVLFHALDAQRDQIRDKAGDSSHGTKKLDSAVLEQLPILVPPEALQRLFRDQVSTFHAQWDCLHAQNHRLRAAHDLLLPRLVSGGISL